MSALTMPHAVADYFTAAEFDFFAIDCVVTLDLDGEGSVDAAGIEFQFAWFNQ